MQAMLSTRHSSNGRGYDIHNVYSAFRKVMMRVRIPVFHLIFIIFVAFFVISLFVCLFLFWLFLMLFYTSVFVVFFCKYVNVLFFHLHILFIFRTHLKFIYQFSVFLFK